VARENDKLVNLVRLDSPVAAHFVVAALEDAGIKATTSDVRLRVAVSSVWVLVMASELERARLVINELREDSTGMDWSKVDFGQPEGN
jgi:hypothetical protein